ncbi:WhiB family transcriptional regulator [Nocardioides sp.]|uniref:WhiB family transcriptional regulator n=1 Tax=Nocardioides sp. TaxID=35761 RepID=UPI003568AB9C
MFDADSLCAETDPDVWFPERGGSANPAKAMCRRCENEDACLEWALTNGEEIGVWGGKSAPERRKLLADRQLSKSRKQADINHGTEGGYRAHQRRGEVIADADPCGCRGAYQLAAAQRRERRAA